MDDPGSTKSTAGSPSQANQATQAASEAASRTAGTAKEEGKAVASTATEQAKSVAGEAATQAKSVADEARGQASRVIGDASSELQQQVDQRLSQAATSARSTAGQLRALAEGRPQEAGRSAELIQQASERLETLASRADELGVRGVADELANIGRQRPLLFLAGAVVAGVAAGRMLRGVQAANASPSSGTRPSLPAQAGPSGVGGYGETTRKVVAPASGSVIGGDAVPAGQAVQSTDPSVLPGAGTISSPGGVG